MVHDLWSWFMVEGLEIGIRVWELGFMIYGSGFVVWCSGLGVHPPVRQRLHVLHGFDIWGVGLCIYDLRFTV